MIRDIFRALAASVIMLAIIIVVPVVSASTTNLSSEASYAEGPFLFWCNPYVKSFVEDRHYEPTTGPCKFSIPNTITGVTVIGVYRGTVESATLVVREAVTGSPTLTQLDSVSFSGVADEEALFAVVYDSALDEGTDLFNTYLQSGGEPPAGAVEGANYHVLTWVYGPKPPSEWDPVLLMPDILTTWETDDEIVIDPLFNTYQNLTDTLLANGYVEGQTFFTLPYNWEESGVSVAEELADALVDIKSICNCSLVDIVAHGTAGLVATHYIQSGSYAEDIDQLVFVGTPFNGVPGAYAAWEAGLVQFDEPVRSGLAQALLNHKAAVGGHATTFAYVQAEVPAFLEMLPVSDYISGQSYPTGHPQNPYLENIQNNFTQVATNGVQAHQFDSDSGVFNTTEGFAVSASSNPPLWPDGEISSTFLTTGDSMVPYLSAELFAVSDEFLFDIDHHDLSTAAQSGIYTALSGVAPTTVVDNNYDASCVLFLSVSAGTDLQITDPNNLRLGKDFDGGGTFEEIDRSVYSGAGAAAEYLAFANPIEGTYQVRTQGTASGSFTLTASDVCNSATHSTTTEGVVEPGQVLGYSVTVGEDDSVTIAPLDSGAPVVTITSPVAGQTYLTTDEVLAAATVSDPEGSPIAQTLYLLNGEPINPAEPLPFVDELIGTTTLEVAAKDVFGNTGSSTIEFFLAIPAPLPGEYTVEFLAPIDKYCYLGSKKPYFKLWKYVFSRLHLHSTYNNYDGDDWWGNWNKKKHFVSCKDIPIFKAGSNVPVRFKVRDENGASVQVDGVIPWIVPTKGPKLNLPVEEAEFVEQPSTGYFYNWNGNHYAYNWKTMRSAGGFWYHIYIVLPDGSIHTTIIGLR